MPIKKQLKLSLLGTFEAQLDGRYISSFEYDKVRALLAYLVVESDRPHRRDVLTGLFWPQQSDSIARKSLNQALYTLRKAVGDKKGVEIPFVLADRTAVKLNPDANVRLDVRLFEESATVVSSINDDLDSTHVQQLQQTAALYQGDLLQGLTISDSPAFDDWLTLARERLHRLAMSLFETLTDMQLAQGEWSTALTYAKRQVELEPWREGAHRQILLILARMGEYNGAVAQYEICRTVLAEELDLEPMPETTALYERIQAVRDLPLHHNLPPEVTGFVGRTAELMQLQHLLAHPQWRLITIVGLGGIGKTRLALAAARRQVNAFLEGVCFVSLVALETTHPHKTPVPAKARDMGAIQLAITLADALNLPLQGQQPPRDELLNYISHREILLVLDNFEHLLSDTGTASATALLSKILRKAGAVNILVTSRERLQLPGEWVVDLGGLAYPEGETSMSTSLNATVDPTTYDAMQLFQQSVQRIQSDYVAREETAHFREETRAVIGQICRLVDGSPLGIELAAAWGNILSPSDIALEIQQSLDFLETDAPHVLPRQRSIRAVFDATWRRLNRLEQDLFAQLSVFRGGFTQTAVREVTGATLRTLSALVNKACLQFDPAHNRYHIHELLRQYGAEKLGDKQIEAERRMAIYFQTFAQTHQKEYDQLRPEWPNMMLGMRRAYEQQAWPLVLAYADSLDQPWFMRARFTEMRQGLEWAKETAVVLDDQLALAKIYTRWGEACLEQDDRNQATDLFQKSLALFEKLEKPLEAAKSKYHLARIAIDRADYETAERLLLASQQVQEQFSDLAGMAATLYRRARIFYVRGQDNEMAERLCKQAMKFQREINDKRELIATLRLLAQIVQVYQDYATARLYCEQAKRLSEDLQDQGELAAVLYSLVMIERWEGNFAIARGYAQQSLELFKQMGNRKIQAMLYYQLGCIHKEQFEFMKAYQLAKKSFVIFQDICDDVGRVLTLCDISYCLRQLGKPARANVRWQEAEELANYLNNPRLFVYLQQHAN